MAYITQEMKKELAPAIKAVLKKYGVKGTISIRHHSVLSVNIKEGALDFIGAVNKRRKEDAEREGIEFYDVGGYYQENPYGGCYRGRVSDEPTAIDKFLDELRAAMRGNLYYNNDDIMTDYFDSAYFMDINIGQYDRPYNFIGA